MANIVQWCWASAWLIPENLQSICSEIFQVRAQSMGNGHSLHKVLQSLAIVLHLFAVHLLALFGWLVTTDIVDLSAW